MVLDQYLQKIGLNDKQAKVYLAGLQLGPASIQQLSKASGIKRSTVYEVMDDLIDQNMFTVSQKGKRKVFTVQEPDNLLLYLKQKEKVLEQIMPDLEALKNSETKKPAIRVYEGIDGLKQIYEDMIKKPGEITAMAAPKQKIAATLLDYLVEDWKDRRIKNGIKLRMISSGKNKKDQEELKEIKYLPEKNYPFSVGIYTYRKKVAFVSYQPQEMIGLVLRSEEINKTIKLIFEMLWQIK